MKFFIEPQPVTGLCDSTDIQSIGGCGNNVFVVEAQTEEEALGKLIDLLVKRVDEGQIRPVTEDEAQECGKAQSRPMTPQSSKQPSKAAVLAELLRVIVDAKTPEVGRDYFRANSRIGDKWNLYWPSFKAFLAAASDDNDLYYEALVELVTEK